MASEDDAMNRNSSSRATGFALAASSMLSLVVLAFHPTTNARGPAQFVDAISRIATADRVVHGVLIALSGLQFACFWVFASHLGPCKLTVRAGLVAYGMGTAAMAVAALTNGFVLPEYAAGYQNASEADLETMRHVMKMSRTVNQVCAQAGLVAISTAVFLWSIMLMRRRGEARTAGVVGLVAVLLPPAALLTGRMEMNLYGMSMFVLAQTTWSLVAAALLVRGRLELASERIE